VKGIVSAALRLAADIVYPPRCQVCGKWSGRAGEICPDCGADFEWISRPLCPICGKPFESSPHDHPCGGCLAKKPHFDALRSAAVYNGSMRKAILRFKFSGKTVLARQFGNFLFEVFESEYCHQDFDAVIPVPLHRERLRWRGFNQSLLLARELGRRTGLWVDSYSLARTRPTIPQVNLTANQRAINVKGAFDVRRPRFIKNRHLLLVDDISTTGITLDECARTLKKHGAASVYCLTVASSHAK